ncbi:hypothetical protein HAX54_002315, partial [Datura stramonium]|nr:hypothetical protein [Datura stramonium]
MPIFKTQVGAQEWVWVSGSLLTTYATPAKCRCNAGDGQILQSSCHRPADRGSQSANCRYSA